MVRRFQKSVRGRSDPIHCPPPELNPGKSALVQIKITRPSKIVRHTVQYIPQLERTCGQVSFVIVGNRISILLLLATQKPACRGLSSPVRPAHCLTANQESGRSGLHSPFSHFHKFSVMLTVKELGFEWRSP